MITGELKNQVDRVWDAFWSGGISNPLEVIEQITYLLFIRRLDELQTLEENKANRTRQADRAADLPSRQDAKGRPYADLRWSRFKNIAPGDDVRRSSTSTSSRSSAQLGGEGSTYAHHMKDARFTIPTPGAAGQGRRHARRDPDGGPRHQGRPLRVHALARSPPPGQNGQFRTPRHIIALMVEMIAPTPKDEICDPACGTAGFLVAAGEYLRDAAPEAAARRGVAASTSTTACSTASTSTAPCCASAA